MTRSTIRAGLAQTVRARGADTGAEMESPVETRAFQLIVNGEPNAVLAETLAEALVALGYEDAIIATALNGEFVPARKRAATPVKSGDRIEIVAPRQGG